MDYEKNNPDFKRIFKISSEISLSIDEKNNKINENNYIPQKIIINSPIYISKDKIDIINKQMEICLCKVKIHDNIGTGFFSNIPFPNKSGLLPVLITSSHILNKKTILLGTKLDIFLNNEKKHYTIVVDRTRLVYISKKYDFAFIAIQESFGFSDKMNIRAIGVDQELLESKSLNIFRQMSIYLIHYSKNNNSEYLLGVIKSMNSDYSIKYNFSKEKKLFEDYPLTCCPIINLNNYKLIGLHQKSPNNKNY